MKHPKLSQLLCSTVLGSLLLTLPAMAWSPKKAPLMTKWAAQVNPQAPLPDYPRPQFTRKDWLNLNGIWQYQSGNEGDALPTGQKLNSEICVPYPVESALSGVMELHDRLWYKRTFTVPAAWKGKHTMLNFGAVDYESEVYINGQSLGVHTGGYESFSYDVTPYLKGTGPQELIVRVFDPTDKGGQPRGKQTLSPGGIMYRSTSGIWQTVWMEPVAPAYVQSVHMVPDIDRKVVNMTVNATGGTPQTKAVVKIMDTGKTVKTVTLAPNTTVAIPVANPKLWSPDSPFLYDVSVDLTTGKTVSDRVGSYFGMRKISLGTEGGFKKLYLNNKFTFQMGPLDQGFWPDGLYTAPTDDALKFDIQAMKQLGFNMVRKHIKVEPARWYYWTDRLGLMVWQDMPSPNSYTGNPAPLDKPAFEKQLRNTIATHWNVPSIVMWVIFNENQGRHDTAYLCNLAKTLDPSRMVNRDSGSGYEGNDSDVGDIDDVHSYPPPGHSGPSPTQALACGEYGGIGFETKDHMWRGNDFKYSTYTTLADPKGVEDLYGEFTAMLKSFRDNNGLSAAVYTEITDVETELNGLYTYDRLPKFNTRAINLANHFAYPAPTYRTVMPTSETTKQTWRYSLAQPAGDWASKTFNDAAWQTGLGGFGTEGTPGAVIGTLWNTNDIWLRRTFNPGPLNAEQLARLLLRDHHDDAAEFYINGVLAFKNDGYTSTYERKTLSKEAQRALIPNGENVMAIHCHQDRGGQFIDAGLEERIPAPQ